MKTLTIYYRDASTESFRKVKSIEKARGILSRRGDIKYATYGGEVIQGNAPVKMQERQDKELQEIIANGDLDAFDKYIKRNK